MSTPTSDRVAREVDIGPAPPRPLPTDRRGLVRHYVTTRRDWRTLRASGAAWHQVWVAWPGVVKARIDTLTPVRAWNQLSLTRGAVFAAGIAYFAMFSLFAALAVAVTAVGFLLRGSPAFRDAVVQGLDSFLPGLLTDAPGTGGVIDLDSLVQSGALTLTGVIGLVVLLFTALGWLGSVREGIRAVFGLEVLAGNPVLTKLRDLATLAVIGTAIVLSGAVSLLAGSAGRWLLELAGVSQAGTTERVVVTAIGVVLGLGVDLLTFALLFRLLAGLRLPRRVMWQAALVGALGVGALRLLGGQLLAGVVANNPLLASFAVLAGLLIWFNLMARVTLVAAAWAAIMWAELHYDRTWGADPTAGTGPRR